MDRGTSRERSPLRYPAAANMAFTSSLSHPSFDQSQLTLSSTSNTDTSSSFDQQALFEQELAQQLNAPSFNGTLPNNAINTSMNNPNFDPSILDISNQNHLSPHSLSNHTSPAAQGNLSFPTFDFDQDINLNPDLNLLPHQAQQNNRGDFNLGGNAGGATMSAVTHSPTPPHLLPRNSNSPSPHASPAAQHSPFAQTGRPRNTSESLDPLSAAYPQRNSGDWTNMAAYRGHRRVHSDNLSDISSHSNQASPYLATLESFENSNHASPLLDASQDPMLGDALGIGRFSLNDQQSAVQQNFHTTPGHSPHISPRLGPQSQQHQQPLPVFTADNNFGLNTGLSPQFPLQNNTFDMFNVSEPFPSVAGNDIGQADHMSPPEINIDFAPNQKPLDAPRMAGNGGDLNLTPPLRPPRNRAKSASHADIRPPTPSIIGRGRSPSLQPNLTTPDTLSPLSAHGSAGSNPSSRSSSPHRGRASSLTNRGRSTSATSDQREYILDLANPERSPSNGGENRRAQKHPATFQCHLCPKRFTRAYNLRSHLRTHTDERPFVCTVCGKAFARQHDRKRHEGLHSGEKKFVCRGPLKNGEQWGCNRRFARADALGRHFRSEAGRVCIRPLLEEEAAEQQQANNAWMEQQQHSNAFGQPQPQPAIDFGANSFLPARILEQYPALAGIDWTSAAAQSGADDDSYGGRNSFDASSGGEMYDDLSEGEFLDPGPAMGLGLGNAYPLDAQQKPFGQRQPAMNAFGISEYTNGFDGGR